MLRTGICLLSLCVLPGCTLAFKGNSQDVEFTSKPPGATVSVLGLTGTTPCTLHLPHSARPVDLRVQKPGRIPFDGVLPTRTMSWWLLAPLLFDTLTVLPLFVETVFLGVRFADWPSTVHLDLPETGSGKKPQIVIDGEPIKPWEGLRK